MCGIFGVIGQQREADPALVKDFAHHARQRGVDASGLIVGGEKTLAIYRADADVKRLLTKVNLNDASFVLGHSRLVTNGFRDNQPVFRDGLIVLHNGIVTNCEELWTEGRTRHQEVDTEIIPVLLNEQLAAGADYAAAVAHVFATCKGVISAAVLNVATSELLLMSNNGSLYVGERDDLVAFSSEEAPLLDANFKNIRNIRQSYEVITTDMQPDSTTTETALLQRDKRLDLVPSLSPNAALEALLEHPVPDLRRCTRCILPETMPYISFDDAGVCNYCHNYTLRNVPKPASILKDLVGSYRRDNHVDCIVPFSGGRDSCMALHLIVNELKMNPVTYTYDWGVITDLGRRNISRMCEKLGVENIIIAADIEQKRNYIRKNLEAWLRKPHLGMVSLLTAGDKHFFRYVENVKKQTGVSLNIWGVNPLEVTHFKAGFLGVPPAFHEEHVYNNGLAKQLHYQRKRFAEYFRNPAYFNSSIPDTISGEYWRSVHKKTDYFHIFDYYTWDEEEVDGVLENYDWEKAVDTNTTWRIGDGTAALYNYIYFTVAGFSEHDTFRSNQIRENQMTRDQALALVEDENRPRYQNIKWYLDIIGSDYETVIRRINSIPKLYTQKQA